MGKYLLATDLNTTDSLEITMLSALASSDPAVRQHGQMLAEATAQSPWDLLIAEAEAVQHMPIPSWPDFPGLKLKHAPRSGEEGYLLYVGAKADCLAACNDLHDLEISSHAKPNGTTGQYCLIVPLDGQAMLMGAEQEAA